MASFLLIILSGLCVFAGEKLRQITMAREELEPVGLPWVPEGFKPAVHLMAIAFAIGCGAAGAFVLLGMERLLWLALYTLFAWPAAMTDQRTMILPHQLTGGLALAGFVLAASGINTPVTLVPALIAGAGAFIFLFVMWLIGALLVSRGRARSLPLGFGDVLLIAAICLWLGPLWALFLIPPSLVLWFVLNGIPKERTDVNPWGPALLLSGGLLLAAHLYGFDPLYLAGLFRFW